MKTIDTIQNTDEWYKLRNNYLGASEANIIMGQSKFKTPLELWKQKTGEPQKENKEPNFIQARGHRLEEKMRPIMEMLYDTDLPPIVVVSEEYDFLMCSLDGYSETIGCTWENKFCGQEDYDKVASGEMLMHYYPQVQHQLMLTGAPFCIFSVIADNKESENPDFPYKYAYIEVKPDHAYMKNQLLPKLVEFWEMVKNKVSPEIGEKDVIDLSQDDELIELLGKYHEIESLKKQQDEIKKQIFKKLGKAKKAECNGVKITSSKSADKEVPDFERACEEMEIDMSNYMKIQKGRNTKRITFPKDFGEYDYQLDN